MATGLATPINCKRQPWIRHVVKCIEEELSSCPHGWALLPYGMLSYHEHSGCHHGLLLLSASLRERRVARVCNAGMPIEQKQLRSLRSYVGETLYVPRRYHVLYHGAF